jgi:hypothetical protein
MATGTITDKINNVVALRANRAAVILAALASVCLCSGRQTGHGSAIWVPEAVAHRPQWNPIDATFQPSARLMHMRNALDWKGLFCCINQVQNITATLRRAPSGRATPAYCADRCISIMHARPEQFAHTIHASDGRDRRLTASPALPPARRRPLRAPRLTGSQKGRLLLPRLTRKSCWPRSMPKARPRTTRPLIGDSPSKPAPR